MAKSQETFSKKEKEKRKRQKRQEKEQRREERKANSKSGKPLEDMMAYVDEFGNISATPPDPTRKKSTVKEEEIVIGSRNIGGAPSPALHTGKVTFFNSAKGFGFIKDSRSGESIFFHNKAVTVPIKENDFVAFETQPGPRGLAAVNVRKA